MLNGDSFVSPPCTRRSGPSDGFPRAAGQATPLGIGGFVPFTATDYPGALAAVVFCQGCPWRCPYCHNPHLVPAHGNDPLPFDAILRFLDTRRQLLDAVVFSGGEPTAQPSLAASIAAVRRLGFAIGLHTAGIYPRRLSQVLRDVDWVGLDIKASRAAYEAVTGGARSGDAAFASLDRIVAAGVACEVRTTVHPSLTPPAMLETIAHELATRGVARWILQPFRATGCASAALIASARPDAGLDPRLLERLRQNVAHIELRA